MDSRRRLFAASCCSLIANGIAFSVCTDILGDFETRFHLSKGMAGAAVSWGAIGGLAAQFAVGAMLDAVGAGTCLWLAFAAHLLGTTSVIFAHGFWSLAFGWFFFALAGGLVEATINPLAATMYPTNKTHRLNVLHAWWPGGLILGGLAAFGFSKLLDAVPALAYLKPYSWQIKMGFVYIPAFSYAVLIFGQKFPKTERAQAGVSNKAMFREALRPMFLLLLFCMFLTASTELGPNRWVGVFIKDIVGIRGVLFLVYTSGLMFVLRFFAGPIVHKITPFGLMIASSVLSAVGLLAMSYSQTGGAIFLAATVWGIGVTYYWPTMLGITSERFPKGGAWLLAILGGAAGLFLAYVTVPGMGMLHDHYTIGHLSPEIQAQVVHDGRVDQQQVDALPPEAKKQVDEARMVGATSTFRWMAILPTVLILIFGAMLLYDLARGGYKQVFLKPPGA